MRQLQRTAAAAEDLGTVVIGVPAGEDLELELRLEAVVEGVLVSGSVRGRAVGECVRCLEKVVEDIDVEFRELYYYPDRAREAVAEGEEDLSEISGDCIDLEPAVRDAVVLALPFRPLCSPGCLGLCVQCGVRMVPGHQHETTDPRWAGLDQIFDDTKES
jgi:uncharacterized protein